MSDVINIAVTIKRTISVTVVLANTVVGAVLPRTYNWPQPTNAFTIFRTGDDSDIEQSIFKNARIDGARPELDTQNNLHTQGWHLLINDNIFGNKQRFTDINGGTSYGTLKYFIDHYTGLGWDTTVLSLLGWNTTIDNANSLVHAGFSDWFVPNMNQLISIMSVNDFAFRWRESPYTPPLDENTNSKFWTSTTNTTSTTQANTARRSGMFIDPKTILGRTWNCRKHF